MAYLVCSPTKIICSNVSRLTIQVCREFTCIVLRLEVSGNIQLVHANGWRRPASALQRIEHPASPVIFAGVLNPRHVSMYLNHRVQDVLNMLFFRQRSKPKTEVPICIARQYNAWACGIEVIAGVANFANTWNICRSGTTAKDWQLKVFPETCLKLERDLRLMSLGQFWEATESRFSPCRQWYTAQH